MNRPTEPLADWTTLDGIAFAVMLAGHVAVLVAVTSGAGCP